MECLTCRSLAGERRISPGPFIAEGRHWILDHAYPSKMRGWLVLVPRRHVEALHELTGEEMAEMADMQRRAIRLLRDAFACQKEYVICFAEGEGFHHTHIHLVPRPADLPPELKGPRIFAMLAVDEADAIPPNEIRVLSEELRARFTGIA